MRLRFKRSIIIDGGIKQPHKLLSNSFYNLHLGGGPRRQSTSTVKKLDQGHNPRTSASGLFFPWEAKSAITVLYLSSLDLSSSLSRHSFFDSIAICTFPLTGPRGVTVKFCNYKGRVDIRYSTGEVTFLARLHCVTVHGSNVCSVLTLN